jgi:hypothetical protein
MSTFVIALLIALGGGTWIFTKVQRTTGGANSQQSILFGAIAGVILFILAFIIAGFLPN